MSLRDWLTSDDPVLRAHAEHAVNRGPLVPPSPLAARRSPLTTAPMPAPFVVPPAFRRGWKNCLYASHSQTGCCGGALTCHRLGEVIPLARCVQCLEVDTR